MRVSALGGESFSVRGGEGKGLAVGAVLVGECVHLSDLSFCFFCPIFLSVSFVLPFCPPRYIPFLSCCLSSDISEIKYIFLYIGTFV